MGNCEENFGEGQAQKMAQGGQDPGVCVEEGECIPGEGAQ